MPKPKPEDTQAIDDALRFQLRGESRQEPLWKGPLEDGITQSMIGGFLSCRERFRLRYIEGLESADELRPKMEYGNLWQTCEEYYALGEDWELALLDYVGILSKRYPQDRSQVHRLYMLCKTQFPIYLDYWQEHDPEPERESLAAEYEFDVEYALPSGRSVRLRGKMDDVIWMDGLYVQDNKAKGDVDERALREQLNFDLQMGTYCVAMDALVADGVFKGPLKGIYYNVVRRPLSGGRHSIRQHKPTKKNPEGESEQDFYARLGGLIKEDPEFFFCRMKGDLAHNEIEKFEATFLVPILEEISDWWEWVREDPFNPWREGNRLHWRFPYGTYNPTANGYRSAFDELLNTGSRVGLQPVDRLFKELG